MELDAIETYDDLTLLCNEIDSSEDLLKFLRENQLLKRRGKRCCNRMMEECPYGKSRLFGKTWRCTVCRKTRLLLVGSFFERTKLHPLVILKVAYCYLVMKLNSKAIRTCVKGAPTCSHLTDWLQFCRDVLSRDLLRDVGKLGGVGKVVVVDETALTKPKLHRGRQIAQETSWVLGLYDVEEKKGLLIWIENPSHAAIIPKVEEQGSTIYTDELRTESIIKKITENVEVGTTIITSNSPTYTCLGGLGFIHNTVHNSRGFVSKDGVHRNHTKGYFSRLKTFLRKRHTTNKDALPSYLDEFMWRERHQDDAWPSFLHAVRLQYGC